MDVTGEQVSIETVLKYKLKWYHFRAIQTSLADKYQQKWNCPSIENQQTQIISTYKWLVNAAATWKFKKQYFIKFRDYRKHLVAKQSVDISQNAANTIFSLKWIAIDVSVKV